MANDASQRFFGHDAVYMGEGGAILFIGLLGAKFPEAQFLTTGVLGPASNAHGPNEFLHLPTAKKSLAALLMFYLPSLFYPDDDMGGLGG